MGLAARLLVLTAMLAAGLGGGIAAAQGTPVAGAGGEGHLVVADPAAAAIHVYRLEDLELETSLAGMAVAGHAGFLALPDGRLLFVDEATGELVALALDGAAGPTVVGRAAVPGPVSHFAVDPDTRYAVVGAGDERRPLTLVDLDSFTTRSFDVEAGEAGVMIGGDPLNLFHRNDALMQVESYPIASISRGETTPTGVVDTGAAGHGEAIQHELGRLYLATDDGVDVVQITDSGLEYRTTIPWDASGRDGGRAFFVRLSHDGGHLLSYVADRDAAEVDWGEWQNDVYLADIATDEACRVELAPGLVYRFALADRVALFTHLHPDGDHALLVDVDPASGTFGEVTATIPLDPLSQGPAAGESPWEAESRIAAITPDGRTGFVSHGGDGVISVIDIEGERVAGHLAIPTTLDGGGYLIAVGPGLPFTDTVAR